MSQAISLSLETPMLDTLAAAGIVAKGQPAPDTLKLFASQSDRVLGEVRAMVADGRMTADQGAAFQRLLLETAARVMCHPIIADNRYLTRFAKGVNMAQARHELQQFSVFALQFDVAQAKLVANAPTEEAYTERLQVLLNEKGIPYKEGFEGDLTGQWKMETVHFTWLRHMADGLGLRFEDIGKIWIGQPGTRQFVETVFNTYAGLDQNLALGASFGIENWAANSLWKPWIAGMDKLNATLPKKVNLGYLRYHDKEEEHHSQATLDELLENFLEPWFDSEKFFQGAETILTDGILAYYESQLKTLPDKDATWPAVACGERKFDWHDLPVFNGAAVHA